MSREMAAKWRLVRNLALAGALGLRILCHAERIGTRHRTFAPLFHASTAPGRAPRTPRCTGLPFLLPACSQLVPTTAGDARTAKLDNISQTRTNTSRKGYASDNDTATRRTLTRTTAPSFNSRTRMVSHWACD